MDALPATEITALLGRGTRFEGKLYFEGRVRVDGVFKGEIKSDDTLIIGDGAEVHAEIDVATVIIRGGIVHGNVRASQSSFHQVRQRCFRRAFTERPSYGTFFVSVR